MLEGAIEWTRNQNSITTTEFGFEIASVVKMYSTEALAFIKECA